MNKRDQVLRKTPTLGMALCRTSFARMAARLLRLFCMMVAVVPAGLVVIGVARAQEATPPRTVGYSAITLKNASPAAAFEALKTAGREYGFEAIAADANGDSRTQLIQLMAWLNSRRVQAILLLPVNVDALLPAFKLAEELHIPISTSALPAHYASQNVVTVAFDWKTMGRLGGQALLDCQAKRLGGAPLRVAIIEQPPNPGLVEPRIAGIKEILGRGMDVQIAAEVGPNPDNRAEVYQNVASALRANPQINALIGTDQEQAIGGVLGAKSVGMDPKSLCIVSLDYVMETLPYLTSGEFWAAVDIHLADIQTPFNARVLAALMDGRGSEYRGQVIKTDMTTVETSVPRALKGK